MKSSIDGTTYAKAQLAARMESNQTAIAKFAKIMADPTACRLYALTWASDIFKQTAEFEVAQSVLHSLNENFPIEDIRDNLTSTALNIARYIPQSTSPTSNLAEQYKAAACLEIMNDIRRI